MDARVSCTKCEQYPCLCGHEYQSLTTDQLRHLQIVLADLVREREAPERRQAWKQFLDEYEAEHGKFTEEEIAEADEKLFGRASTPKPDGGDPPSIRAHLGKPMSPLQQKILKRLLAGDTSRLELIALCESLEPSGSISDDLSQLEEMGFLRSYEAPLATDQVTPEAIAGSAEQRPARLHYAITKEGRKALFERVVEGVFARHADALKKLAE
jgi:hypothetical protein